MSYASSDWTALELMHSNLNDSADENDTEITGGFYWCSCCIKGCIIGSLIVGIALAVILALWLTSVPKGTVTTYRVSTSTISTATSSTSSSSTSSSSTTASTTSVTSTTSTTSTTTTTTTATTSTSTSSTTTTSTTTTTSVTTTTRSYQPCHSLRWNQTGVVVAGTGSSGTALNQFDRPNCIHIDDNDSMYICDHQNHCVKKWLPNATSGIPVTNPNNGDHVMHLAVDRSGSFYVSDHGENHVLRYSSASSNGMVVAGQTGAGSSALTGLRNPLGVAVDDNFNVYVADQDNSRVVRWGSGAKSGSLLISSSTLDDFVDILLIPWSSNQVYLSSENRDSVYLWTFYSSSPSVTFTFVNSSTSSLQGPTGIKLDPFYNLFVADTGNKRVVMYCANSTVGQVVVGGSGSTPALSSPVDIALDSNLNLYVVDANSNIVVKYAKL